MAETKVIVLPSFDFSTFYYPDILRSLIQFQRINVPEITDESDEEPFQQLLRAFALVGHLNNVLLDVVANESLLPTSRLLESVRGHLKLIDVRLGQAKPASTEVVLELAKIFFVATNLVPQNTQFATVETDESPQIIFETDENFTIEPTDKPTIIQAFTAGKIKVLNNVFEAGDSITVEGIEFRFGFEWAAGATIPDTINNIRDAINSSTNSAIFDVVYSISDSDILSVIPIDQEKESITISEDDNVTDNFEILPGGFGANKVGLASTDAVFFNLFDDTPKIGDAIYIGHTNILWDELSWVFNTFASGLSLVLEFYDGTLEDAKPDLITNLGSNLQLELTTLLGVDDRSGTVVRVVLSSTGTAENRVSEFSGGKNIITTKGLLGQSVVSTNVENYVVGTFWNEVSDLNDGTTSLTSNGSLEFSLPQNLSQRWTKLDVNTVEGFWLRLRVVSVSSPVNPSVDRIRIDEGKQFILLPITQGQTVADDPLGSSNGANGQQFLLTFKPLIEGTLTVEVDEGSGFQAWNEKENFLNSNNVSKDYVLDIDATDDSTIAFGDGTQGKIPPPGVDNIRSVYRIGADEDGNVGANTITVNKSGISFINSIFNPRQAIGHAVKEGSTDIDLARLKVEGPASLRARGRGITTDDIEFLSTQFINSVNSKVVARALAIEETFGVKTIELVVVGFGGVLLTEAQRDELKFYFNGSKVLGILPVLVANHEVIVVNYTPRIIDVDATVTGGNAETIKNAVTSLLNPEATFDDGVTKRWGFGDEIPFSVIISEIFEVDPVNIKKVTLTTPSSNIILSTKELPLAGNINITVI